MGCIQPGEEPGKAARGSGLAPQGCRASASAWLLAAWAMQSGLPSRQDAVRAKRHQEAKERERRQREKEAVLKKLKTQAELQQSRLDQMACKEHKQMVQTKWDCSYYDHVLR